MGSAALEALLKRDRYVVLAALLALTALAWSYLLWLAGNMTMPSSGMTMPEMALRFILCNDDVHTIIPGMRKVRNVDSNMATGDGKKLPEALRLKLKNHRWDRKTTEWSQ